MIIETVGTGQEAMPFQSKLVDQTVLVMNPDYGARLQLQKIVMLDLADIVVVNKSDQDRARTAMNEIERRLEQNKRDAASWSRRWRNGIAILAWMNCAIADSNKYAQIADCSGRSMPPSICENRANLWKKRMRNYEQTRTRC